MRHASVRICALLVAMLLQTTSSAEEIFNRGLIAIINDQGHIYLGWRLLKDDPADVAFNVYRRMDGGSPVRINPRPITSSTNFIDTDRHMNAPLRPLYACSVIERTRFGGVLGASDAVSEGASSRPRLTGRTNHRVALSFGAARIGRDR